MIVGGRRPSSMAACTWAPRSRLETMPSAAPGTPCRKTRTLYDFPSVGEYPRGVQNHTSSVMSLAGPWKVVL